MNYPLYNPDWTADEELLMLEGIELYGFGNWVDIADHVSTKSADRCRWNYINWYLNRETGVHLPRKLDDATTARLRKEIDEQETSEKVKEQRTTQKKNDAKGASHGDLAGYMPLRQEFDVEYDNEAELIFAEMEFYGQDPLKEDEDAELS